MQRYCRMFAAFMKQQCVASVISKYFLTVISSSSDKLIQWYFLDVIYVFYAHSRDLIAWTNSAHGISELLAFDFMCFNNLRAKQSQSSMTGFRADALWRCFSPVPQNNSIMLCALNCSFNKRVNQF